MRRGESTSLTIAGRALRCPVCEHDRFWTRQALLPKRGLAFLDLEWLSARADLQVCDRCGHVLWFVPPARGDVR